MTIAKGLSSGYQPIGGSIVCDEVAAVIGTDEFNHGYTYSGHPVAAAVALENLRIMQEEKIVEHVRDVAHPYLAKKWAGVDGSSDGGRGQAGRADGFDRADAEQGDAGEVCVRDRDGRAIVAASAALPTI